MWIPLLRNIWLSLVCPPGLANPLTLGDARNSINEAGNQQVFTFVQMQPYSEIYLRCGSLANAADTVDLLVVSRE